MLPASPGRSGFLDRKSLCRGAQGCARAASRDYFSICRRLLKCWLPLCLCLLLLLGSGCAPERNDVAAIEAAADEWIVAFKNGDIDALMSLYMPDAFVALHGQPALRGADEIRAYFAPKMGTADVEFLLEYEQIEVHGDVAHLVSKYWYTGTPKAGGEPYRDAGRSALIYKRDADGRWKIYLDIDQATPDVNFPAQAGISRWERL